MIKKYLTNPLILYGVIGLLVLTNGASVIYFGHQKESCEPVEIAVAPKQEEEPKEEEKQLFQVDIKGYVKNPGVYQVENGTIINDVIKLAGGLKSGGTTENINLSKKVVDEAMIVISSKSALKKSSCVCENPQSTPSSNQEVSSLEPSFGEVKEDSATEEPSPNKKISINTATKEELMTLSGIGEKTAEKIISYRTEKPFTTIEDLKNVSGIGDAVFEKIKDFITV